jgi:ribosomal protein S18 acetylase RimI-like enzyme
MANISIHPFTSAELAATDEVIIAAYHLAQGRKSTLQRYLTLQPDGAFVAKQGSRIVGFGAAKQYTSFAYIGLMAVHPALQKQGIGGMLLEHILRWLDRAGCQTVLLDASSPGVSLYNHYGFVEDDITLVLQQEREPVRSVNVVLGIPDVMRGSEVGGRDTSGFYGEGLSALFAYDAPLFGSDRATLLASYWADDPQRVLVTKNASRQITGYLIAQSSVLGPWVADTVEEAERLLVHGLTLSFKNRPGMFVSARHENALRLFERYGFMQQRTLSHMRRGKRVQRGRHTTLYGQTSLGLG